MEIRKEVILISILPQNFLAYCNLKRADKEDHAYIMLLLSELQFNINFR